MPEQSVVFDRAASFYDATRGFPPGEDRKVAAFIAQAARLTSTDELIEIGVGTGRIALPVAGYIRRLVGIDLSTGMMAKLQQKQQAEYSGRRVFPVQGDVMQLPLASNRFDAALIVHILHLIPQPERAAAELARVLRPGGKALQCWNDRDESVFQPLREAWNSAVKSDRVPQERHHDNHSILPEVGWQSQGEDHVYRFTLRQSPESMVRNYRERVWSSLWAVPDDIWRAGVEALDAALHEQYPDPTKSVEVPCSFHMKIFTPPT